LDNIESVYNYYNRLLIFNSVVLVTDKSGEPNQRKTSGVKDSGALNKSTSYKLTVTYLENKEKVL